MAPGGPFDKVGRLLGLPYPGGPAIQRAAEDAGSHRRRLPRAWLGDSLDFSFSGLKTAVRRMVIAEVGGTADDGATVPDALAAEIAAGFQDSVVDVLATKTALAAQRCGARTIVLGGGVGAHGPLRAAPGEGAGTLGARLAAPGPHLG